jgi:serine O-acetyltransferase
MGDHDHAIAGSPTGVTAVGRNDRGEISEPFVWALPRLSWRQTRARIRADRDRLKSLLLANAGFPQPILLHPSFVCVFLYRISNHFFRAGHSFLARLFWQFNAMLTGADISAAADLGEGLVIMSPAGTAIMGTAGRNLTVMPCAGMGGELGRRENVGAGPGLPLLGDEVILEPHSGALGPIRVGTGVRVTGGVAVTRDVPDGFVVEGPTPRFIPRRDLS